MGAAGRGYAAAMRRLLTPSWLAMHVFIVAVAVTMTLLGAWQLDRLAETSAEAERVDRLLGEAPVAALPDEPGEEQVYRRVEVKGRYLPEDEVLLRSRSHRGQNGWHVVTPLVYEPGRALLVVRGWAPFELDRPGAPETAPPDGEVTVTGFLTASQAPSGFGPRDPETGRLERLFHADVARIDAQVDADLYPMPLQLQRQAPPQSGRLPATLDPPEIDTSQHLSYAVQWFSFALIAVVGYAVVLRRRLRPRDDIAEAPREHAAA